MHPVVLFLLVAPVAILITVFLLALLAEVLRRVCPTCEKLTLDPDVVPATGYFICRHCQGRWNPDRPAAVRVARVPVRK